VPLQWWFVINAFFERKLLLFSVLDIGNERKTATRSSTIANTKKNKFAMWFSPREVHGYSCFYESESTPGLRKILTKYFNGM
jgi:hypothetical protein